MKEKIIVGLLIGVTIVLWFTNQLLINRLYSETPEYENDTNEIQTYIIVNNVLKLKLLHLESYTYINQVATKKGFVPAKFYNLQN